MMKTHEMNGVYTRIEKSTIIKGNLKTNSDIRIDGTMDGNIETKGKIIIGKVASVKGNILCMYAEIEGKFKGKINAQEALSLKSESDVSGEVTIGKLIVASGAKFNATCTMVNNSDKIKSLYDSSEKTA